MFLFIKVYPENDIVPPSNEQLRRDSIVFDRLVLLILIWPHLGLASTNQALDFNKANDVPNKEQIHLEDWKVKRSAFKRKSTSTSF